MHGRSPQPLIGFLNSRSPSESADVVAALGQGLQKAGFIERQLPYSTICRYMSIFIEA
jgi:hypothetical protein